MKTPDPHPPNQPDPLAVALAKLDPTPHGFEWNALMFAAGRESKARAIQFWRVIACACALVACGFAVALFSRPARAPVERIVYVERAAPTVPKAEVPVPQAVPLPQPVPGTEIEPKEPPGTEPAAPWSFDPPPEQGVVAHWFLLRNEVLTVGLGVLPDSGPKVSGPPIEK